MKKSNLNSFLVIGALVLVSSLNILPAQDNTDRVLDQAREKYRNSQVGDNAAQAALNPPATVPEASPVPQVSAAPAASPAPVAAPAPAATPAVMPTMVTVPANGPTTIVIQIIPAASPEPIATPTPAAAVPSPTPAPIAAPAPTPAPIATPSPVPAIVEQPPVPSARPLRAFVFQAVPGLPRRNANADAVVAIGLSVSSVHGVKAAQISLVGNIAKSAVSGFQGAALFNKAGKLTGVQSAGLINIAGDVEGVQIAGLINIGHKVKGLQIGLINISDENDGVALGLINISKKGINEIPVWYGGNDFVYTGLQTGSKNVYLLLYGGEQTIDWFRYINSMTLGASIGVRGKIGSFYLQADAGIKSAVYPTGKFWDINSTDGKGVTHTDKVEIPGFSGFANFRLMAGLTIWGPFSVFTGINADIDGGSYWKMPDRYKTDWNFYLPGKELQAHMSWIFGISL